MQPSRVEPEGSLREKKRRKYHTLAITPKQDALLVAEVDPIEKHHLQSAISALLLFRPDKVNAILLESNIIAFFEASLCPANNGLLVHLSFAPRHYFTLTLLEGGRLYSNVCTYLNSI